MFYRTTLSIYRIAPEDKSWLYAGSSSNISSHTVASALEDEKQDAVRSEDGRAATSSSSSSGSSEVTSTSNTAATETTSNAKCSKLPRQASSTTGSASSTTDRVQGLWIAPFTDCMGKSTPDVVYACPPIMYARLSKRLRGGSMATACVSYSLLGPCCACAMAAPLRMQLRRKYALPEEPCSDGITHLFCSPCAVWQEYREVEAREGAWGKPEPCPEQQQQQQQQPVRPLRLSQQQLKLQTMIKNDLDSARFKDITDDSTRPRPAASTAADSTKPQPAASTAIQPQA